MSGTKPITFISYSRTDAEFALKLGKDLRAAGVNIWIDQLDVSPGARWDNTVEEALKNCDTLLIILSTASVSSENVLDEFAFALEENKKIVPVLYRDCKLPLRLRRMQYIDFTKNYEAGLIQLKNTLSSDNLSPPIKLEKAEQPTEGVPSVKRKNLTYAFGLILLLIIIVGVGTYLKLDGGGDKTTSGSSSTAVTTEPSIDSNLFNILHGVWQGQVRSSLSTPYDTEITINTDDYVVKTEGSNDSCVGRLTLENQSDNSVSFQYQLADTVRGMCFPVGSVVLSNISNQSMNYLWQDRNGIAQVNGTLYKTE